MTEIVTYGDGGFDPSKQDGNVTDRDTVQVDPEVANRATIEDGIRQGLDAMQQIIDAPPVSFSNLAQAQAAVRDIQSAVTAEARQLRRLTRLALDILDGTE